MDLTLEEAVRGITKEIRIPTLETCDKCHGSGAKEGTSAETCSTCHGAGQVHLRQGFFTVQQPCPTCHGRGKVIKSLALNVMVMAVLSVIKPYQLKSRREWIPVIVFV